MDESNWQNLNKKLHRISSATDGKYDAKTEIEVPPKSLLFFSILSRLLSFPFDIYITLGLFICQRLYFTPGMAHDSHWFL